MNKTLTLVTYMAVVTWLLIVVASLIRAKAWTPAGMFVAFGNRENVAEPTAFAGRAERTARNTLENFVLFAAIALVANTSNSGSPSVALGAEVFFWARIVYIPVYYIGVPYVRTTIWFVSIIGLAMMVAAIL